LARGEAQTGQVVGKNRAKQLTSRLEAKAFCKCLVLYAISDSFKSSCILTSNHLLCAGADPEKNQGGVAGYHLASIIACWSTHLPSM